MIVNSEKNKLLLVNIVREFKMGNGDCLMIQKVEIIMREQ